MKTDLRAVLIAPSFLFLFAADDPKSSAKLDVPKGWRTEDTTYPPPWAKSLPWKGQIEIRFPPGWFQAKSEEYWSYPVLYSLFFAGIAHSRERRRC